MNLLIQGLRERLLANGVCEADHVPVVKFFNPVGAATWLLTEMDSDGDTLFGLCDLGFGFPELGLASLSEIASVRLPLGLGIERDLHFERRIRFRSMPRLRGVAARSPNIPIILRARRRRWRAPAGRDGAVHRRSPERRMMPARFPVRDKPAPPSASPSPRPEGGATH